MSSSSVSPNSAACRVIQRFSCQTRPLAPYITSCATVGQSMRPAGSPRYSRSSSGSGRLASDIMWLVAKPSMVLATGISDNAAVR